MLCDFCLKEVKDNTLIKDVMTPNHYFKTLDYTDSYMFENLNFLLNSKENLLLDENTIISFLIFSKSSWNIFDIVLRFRSFFDVEIFPLNKKALSFSFILISSDLNFMS